MPMPMPMPSKQNPYAPPRQDLHPLPDAVAEAPKITTSMLTSIVFGGSVTAFAVYSLYVDDPRTGTSSGTSLQIAVFGSTVLSSSIWAVSGILNRNSMVGLLATFGLAGVSAGLWVLIGGTYTDVLGAAACVAWPFGGLVASTALYFGTRYRHPSQAESN